ncbi:MAG: hypothetical protein JJ919_13725 [Henriciella sp.]|nr:hypothetical protein [Henriciella sp.]
MNKTPPAGCYRWRITTKPLGWSKDTPSSAFKVIHVVAANAGIVDNHLCLWDLDGKMVLMRANGSFLDVSRCEWNESTQKYEPVVFIE